MCHCKNLFQLELFYNVTLTNMNFLKIGMLETTLSKVLRESHPNDCQWSEQAESSYPVSKACSVIWAFRKP